MNDIKTDRFAIFAEVKEYDKPLIMHNLPFGRLINDIVVPYKSKKSFFIDGVPYDPQKFK